MRIAIALTAFLLTVTVHANEVQFESTKTFASMVRRLPELEGHSASYEMGGSMANYMDADRCCGVNASCGFNPCTSCGCAGIVAGAEVAWMRAGQSDGGTDDHDYEAATRVWLGYQGCNGLGLRTRWFQYDSRSPTASFLTDLDITTYDFEVTDSFQLGCNWNGIIAGGVRLAEYREGFFNDPSNFFRFPSGVGPVLGIEMSRCVTSRFSLFGLVRESILLDDEYSGIADGVGYNITELQIGAEFRRQIRCGYFFARGAFESQYWSGVSDIDNESITLYGGTLAIGLAR